MAENAMATETGLQALTELVRTFAEVKEQTFAGFDTKYDSAAESQAAKDGWSTLAGGVALIVMFERVAQAQNGTNGSAG